MAYGFSSVNRNLNKGVIINPNSTSKINDILTSVRVIDIILNETHENFISAGEWDALGTITYQNVEDPNIKGIAKPLFGNIKNFPLINEIVYIFSLPNTLIGQMISSNTSYYLNPVALWNHPHHNGYPTNANERPLPQLKSYIQTELGDTSKILNQPLKIGLGKTFVERPNIHPLLPFEGDIIYEGRWGNSIRLGSTVQNTTNNWSITGSNGDPILIIRNGQGTQTEEGWIPTIEDINNDESSLYLTSTQKIPLKTSSTSYFSYKNNPPVTPNEYSGKQVIINSGRLVFNSSEDHILLSSAKSINLNSNLGVNIDTPTFTIQSSNIYLGSKNATEPLLLGNQTINLLNQLISNLSAFTQICSTLVSTPPGTPIPPLNTAATQLVDSLNAIQANLNNLKSKYNYTV